MIRGGTGDEAKEAAIVCLGKLLAKNLRKCDILGHWQDTVFVILLLETGLMGGIKTTRKISKILSIIIILTMEKFLFHPKLWCIRI